MHVAVARAHLPKSVAPGLAAAGGSVAVAWVSLHPGGVGMLGALVAFGLAVIAPVWISLTAALCLAAGFGAYLGLHVPSGTTGAAIVVIVGVAVRAIVGADDVRLRVGRAFIVAIVLLLGFAAVVVDGGAVLSRPVIQVSLPYLLIVLAAFCVDGAALARLFDAVAYVSVIFATLFLLDSFLGLHLLPGATNRFPATFAGVAITRVQSYGQLLPTLGLMWASASLVSGVGRRPAMVLVALVDLFAVVVGLGRTALIATLTALAIMALLALRARHAVRGKALRLLAVVVSTFVGALLYLSQRLSDTLDQVATGSGTWGDRVSEWQTRSAVIANHLVVGVGFDARTGNAFDYGTSDSSLLTVLVRFGLFGAIALTVAILIALRRGVHLASFSAAPAGQREGLFVVASFVYLLLSFVTTSSFYYPVGIAASSLLMARLASAPSSEEQP